MGRVWFEGKFFCKSLCFAFFAYNCLFSNSLERIQFLSKLIILISQKKNNNKFHQTNSKIMNLSYSDEPFHILHCLFYFSKPRPILIHTMKLLEVLTFLRVQNVGFIQVPQVNMSILVKPQLKPLNHFSLIFKIL